jgi:hypothetical protein
MHVSSATSLVFSRIGAIHGGFGPAKVAIDNVEEPERVIRSHNRQIDIVVLQRATQLECEAT